MPTTNEGQSQDQWPEVKYILCQKDFSLHFDSITNLFREKKFFTLPVEKNDTEYQEQFLTIHTCHLSEKADGKST